MKSGGAEEGGFAWLTPGDEPLAGGAPEEFRSLIAVLPVPAVLFRGSHVSSAVVAEANAASADTLGQPLAPGRPLSDLLRVLGLYSPGRRETLPWDELPIVRALEHGETVRRAEVHLRRPDGQWRVVLVSAAPVCSEGQIVGAIAVFVDITERLRMRQRLTMQYEVGNTLSQAVDLNQAGPRILEAIGNGMEWSYGALWVRDEEGTSLRCVETWHAPGARFLQFEAATREIALSRGSGLPGRVWMAAGPVWIPDVSQDARFPRRLAAALEGVRGGFGFPILLEGRVLGVFEFFSQDGQLDAETAETMAAIGSQVGQFIERKRTEEALREAQRQTLAAYRREHAIAARFQGGVVPKRAPRVPGFAMSFTYRPALPEADVGGDFYNVFRIDAERIGVVLGDVGGKGLEAAVIAAWLQHAIVALAMGERALPERILDDIRRAVTFLEEPDRLVTVFLGILDQSTGGLRYSSAGHEPALVWRAAAGRVEVLPQAGPAIISLPTGSGYLPHETVLASGDLLLLYTDGLPDARAGHGRPPLGRDRVAELLAEHHAEELQAIVKVMCCTARRHSEGRLPDDIALVAIRRLEDAEAAPEPVFVEHADEW